MASAVVWFLLVVNFSALTLNSGDANVQYGFVRRMFGDAHRADGYFFGLALVEAPFYAIGKGLDRLGLHTVSGHSVEESSVVLGLGLLTLSTWPLLRSVLRGLTLGRIGFALLAAALGTPFFYYATFVPGKNHAIDTVLFTGVIYLVWRYFARSASERWIPYALGAIFGLSYTVRYFSGAEAVVLVVLLVFWRRLRDAAEIAITSAVVCGLLFLIPAAFDVRVFSGGNYSSENVLTLAPLNPLRMLFTDHRGYFVWSPVAALAAAGFVILFRRRPDSRRFLVAVVGMGLGIIASYSLVAFWDGTWTFGQRYLTPLFPVVAIGLAGLLDAASAAGVVLASLAAAWSLYLCFNWVTLGGGGVSQYVDTPSASTIALAAPRAHTSLGSYGFGIWQKSNLLQPFIAWPFSHASSSG